MFIHSPDAFFTPGSHSSPVLGPEATELVHAALTFTESNSSKGSRIGLQNRALGTHGGRGALPDGVPGEAS